MTEQLSWWVVGIQADFGLRLGIKEDAEQGAVFESKGTSHIIFQIVKKSINNYRFLLVSTLEYLPTFGSDQK